MIYSYYIVTICVCILYINILLLALRRGLGQAVSWQLHLEKIPIRGFRLVKMGYTLIFYGKLMIFYGKLMIFSMGN